MRKFCYKGPVKALSELSKDLRLDRFLSLAMIFFQREEDICD
jgi:hypothetical protein